ncbi:sugar ABC transporter permease [Gottschalkiaceae bacterium SANA]|nr:sugar ABC transporter permease [Gottschalkiaceae bacterium SANA]
MERRGNRIPSGWGWIAPGLLGLGVFYLIPMGRMVMYALQNESGEWGFGKIAEVLSNVVFQLAFRNTMVFVSLAVISITVISLLISLLVQRMTWYPTVVQSVLFSPMIIPTASVMMVFDLFFRYDGVLNTIFRHFGSGPVEFYHSKMALVTVLLLFLWKNIGYNVIILTAALENVNRAMYEAASIDGANQIQQFRLITLPSIRGTLIFVIMISVLNAFKAFREIYLLLGSYPDQSIYSLQHYMNNLFLVLDYQKLSVAALTVLIGVLLFVGAMLAIDRKGEGV